MECLYVQFNLFHFLAFFSNFELVEVNFYSMLHMSYLLSTMELNTTIDNIPIRVPAIQHSYISIQNSVFNAIVIFIMNESMIVESKRNNHFSVFTTYSVYTVISCLLSSVFFQFGHLFSCVCVYVSFFSLFFLLINELVILRFSVTNGNRFSIRFEPFRNGID